MVLGSGLCSGSQGKWLGRLQYLGVRDLLGGCRLTIALPARQWPKIGWLTCYVDLFRLSCSRDK